MPKKLRVGLIGAGGIAQAHMEGWQQSQHADVVAICDIKRNACEDTAERWDVAKETLYEDYNKMLKQVELDAVDICTPNAYHKGPTVAAFKAGCHVLVEKPVTISAGDCRQMIAAGKKARRLLMVAQVMRFGLEGQTLRAWVDAGLVGRVYWGHCTLLRARGVPSWGEFIDAEASGGGPCYDIGVHILDLALWLMDFPEPVSVSAATYREIANKPSLMKHSARKYTVPEDMAAGFIRFKNGATLSLQTSWTLNVTEAASAMNVILCGTKGGLQCSPPTLVREQDRMLVNRTPQVPVDVNKDRFAAEIAAFVDAIRKGKPSPVPGEQALITQRILDGIYASGAAGKEVKV